MKPVGDQLFIDGANVAHCSDQHGEPSIVQPMLSGGKTEWRVCGAEHDGRAGHIRALGERLQVAALQRIERTLVESKIFPEREGKKLAEVIDHIGIRKDQAGFRMLDEFLLTAFQSVSMPHVVLVRKGNQIAVAGSDSLLEIPGRSQVSFVHDEPHWKRRSPGKCLNQVRRRIGRSIIANYQLIRQPRLPQDARQLRSEKPLAVVGTHGY